MRRLCRGLSYLIGVFRFFRSRMQAHMPLFCNDSRNQLASQPRSSSIHLTPGNPRGSQAELRQRYRCAERPVHPARQCVIHSDNGPEFIAQAVQDWIKAVGAKTAYIEPGSPWENGYCESVNARFRDEFLNGEIFYCLPEAQIRIEQWRKHYNTKRPHSALGYRPPARKPSSKWTQGRSCTNNQIGPSKWG